MIIIMARAPRLADNCQQLPCEQRPLAGYDRRMTAVARHAGSRSLKAPEAPLVRNEYLGGGRSYGFWGLDTKTA